MAELARNGAGEGLWLRAERQTAGKGRQGRAWQSPLGNLYVSTLVRTRQGEPSPATLALVAAVALEETVSTFLFPGEGRGPVSAFQTASLGPGLRRGEPMLKWPNDVLIDGAKLSGILLERVGDAVILGFGVNLAHHPEDLDRKATSLATHGVTPDPQLFAETLAESFARWVSRWRDGIAPVRERWLVRAHPIGTALTARLADGSSIDGLFGGLDSEGALILRLADGTSRVIHAADVFLL
ncbi:BirA family biotin operon repressor/biotin-[acetyl-CoA-carboxylase] ligase [Sphingomonas kyeonggiensis]|uniref:biotin--[acetyl-CoA-carboxylase] ligase n=1 Tax=Sphingomonas kyeonggiensis TaxID=1268553 RepID=UPI00277E8BB4|nr:biotin--[acetyl-CoA-carboxylase] ligase [Sphingomonas kyeonggiensis]MDQ0251183.1 BirA family biotin operon repressor/biotin-[acetyl-CoA-carboxylase] ligase [Sphingomonas kyeonggiensis]